MTAAHVIADKGTVFWLKAAHSQYVRARLVAYDKDSDVAVLAAHDFFNINDMQNSTVYSEIQIRESPLRPLERVYTRGGCQHGDAPITLTGEVACVDQTFTKNLPNQKHKFIQLVMPTVPGLSGAPVMDGDGRLAGMVVKKFLEYGVALPVGPLLFVVDELLKAGKCEPKNLGFVVKSRMRIYNDEDVIDGLVITAVDSGGLADKAGLLVGDFVVEVNGLACTGSACDVHDALVKGNKLMLGVRRGKGNLVEIQLDI